MTEEEAKDFDQMKSARDALLITNARLHGKIDKLEKIVSETKRVWVDLEPKDMSDDPDQMYDHPFFTAGVIFASKILMEKNS